MIYLIVVAIVYLMEQKELRSSTYYYASLFSATTRDLSVVAQEQRNLLCESCRQVVEQTPLISLEWLNVSNGEHPHKMALDEAGNGPFRYNVKRLRENPPPYIHNQTLCNVVDRENQALVRIQIASSTSSSSSSKLLCAVYASQEFHSNVQFIRETWGPQCDGFFVGSDATDPNFDAVHVPHFGPEVYQNMFHKVRSLWSYIYHNYYDDYAWFHLGGDDMLLIVPNLRQYLDSEEIRTAGSWNRTHQVPLFLGLQVHANGHKDHHYVTGGPGYTINKAALKILVTQAFTKSAGRWSSAEDYHVSRAFLNLKVAPYPTNDAVTGQERYHHFPPGRVSEPYIKSMPFWFRKASRLLNRSQSGPEYCHPYSVAFHYVKGLEMKRLHAILYNQCGNSATEV